MDGEDGTPSEADGGELGDGAEQLVNAFLSELEGIEQQGAEEEQEVTAAAPAPAGAAEPPAAM